MKIGNKNAGRLLGGFLTAVIVLAISCSKTNSPGKNTPPGPPPADATHIYLPDSAFRNYLQAKICPDAFDKNGRLDISNSEVTGFTGTMTIDSSTYKIQSVTGIAYFTSMKKLIIQSSLVDSLNLPTAMAVDTIRLLDNVDMQYVNLKGCSGMRYIRFSNIPVRTMDLSNLPALNTISGIASGRLNSLLVNNDGNLQHILLHADRALSTVNTSTCPNLQRLYLDYCNGITGLDLSNNAKLKILIVTNAGGLQKVDLSHNPAVTQVQFDECGIDSMDFSHNPALFGVSMTYMSALKSINVLSNPHICKLWLDGDNMLTSLDLRAQTNFTFYQADFNKVTNNNTISDADMWELYPDGYFQSPTPGGIFTIADSATRKFEGATMNLYGGLRVPMYLDVSALSLTSILVNDAFKNNYSLLMSRETAGIVPQPVVTVYAADQTTILCHDYSPELETCNN
jgi:hypothetical protein